jgi:hypothetical protein
VRLALQLHRAGQAVERRGRRLAEAQFGQLVERGRFGGGIAVDDFGDVADLAHHALRRVEGHALAVVIEGQHGEIMPALGAGVGQRHESSNRMGCGLTSLRRRWVSGCGSGISSCRPCASSSCETRFLSLPVSDRGLRHQRLQFGQRNIDAAAVQGQRAAGQVVDIPRRIGRQHVVDQVGAR